jgi:hypothetical protein
MRHAENPGQGKADDANPWPAIVTQTRHAIQCGNKSGFLIVTNNTALAKLPDDAVYYVGRHAFTENKQGNGHQAAHMNTEVFEQRLTGACIQQPVIEKGLEHNR